MTPMHGSCANASTSRGLGRELPSGAVYCPVPRSVGNAPTPSAQVSLAAQVPPPETLKATGTAAGFLTRYRANLTVVLSGNIDAYEPSLSRWWYVLELSNAAGIIWMLASDQFSGAPRTLKLCVKDDAVEVTPDPEVAVTLI